MSISGELWDTVRKLSALESRTTDIVRIQERIEVKIDSLIERIARLETRHEGLRENVRNEILADIKSDLARMQLLFDLRRSGGPLDSLLGDGAGAAVP
ncbi:MAG TPA: hypothetical protein VLQ45_23795 [Thermoanaerobaculia bacterium]|nr:hypothetical protein [Thermoanaerobaculia bacterium]